MSEAQLAWYSQNNGYAMRTSLPGVVVIQGGGKLQIDAQVKIFD